MHSLHIQILIIAVTAIVSGLVTFLVARQQYKSQKRKDIITGYLIDVWCDLESCAEKIDFDKRTIEKAIAKIQFLGNKAQIKAASNFISNLEKNNKADIKELLQALRKELRNELSLCRINTDIEVLRMKK